MRLGSGDTMYNKATRVVFGARSGFRSAQCRDGVVKRARRRIVMKNRVVRGATTGGKPSSSDGGEGVGVDLVVHPRFDRRRTSSLHHQAVRDLLSRESQPSRGGKARQEKEETHLEQPQLVVRDLCQHIPYFNQFKVTAADLLETGEVSPSFGGVWTNAKVRDAQGGRLWVSARSRRRRSPAVHETGRSKERTNSRHERTRMSETPATTRTSPSALIISAITVTPAAGERANSQSPLLRAGEMGSLDGCCPSKTARMGSPFLGNSGSSYLTEGCCVKSNIVELARNSRLVRTKRWGSDGGELGGRGCGE